VLAEVKRKKNSGNSDLGSAETTLSSRTATNGSDQATQWGSFGRSGPEGGSGGKGRSGRRVGYAGEKRGGSLGKRTEGGGQTNGSLGGVTGGARKGAAAGVLMLVGGEGRLEQNKTWSVRLGSGSGGREYKKRDGGRKMSEGGLGLLYSCSKRNFSKTSELDGEIWWAGVHHGTGRGAAPG